LVSAGTIKNLHIASGVFNYTGRGTDAAQPRGVFVADNNKGTIEGCSNAVNVNSTGISAGGICGRLTGGGKIIACVNKGNITSDGRGVGGICGQQAKGDIIACYNTGTIYLSTNTQDLGGISGRMGSSGVSISACYNTGEIKGGKSGESGPIGGTNANEGTNCFSVSSGTITVGVWPNSSLANWGIGNDATAGKYWKSYPNSWDGVTCPRLYWEED
jgi:hypothetical protein